MALSASVLGNLIDTNLASHGAVGTNRTPFANAIATGIVNSIVGKTFMTLDTGVGSGGTGIGMGIFGLSSTPMQSVALANMTSQGSNASNMMNAIMAATVQHLGTAASLVSVDPSVGNGNGVIIVGSITVVQSQMSSNIKSALQAASANGSNLQNLCDSIAKGICMDIISSGTGDLVISGGTVVPPSSGTGTGVIS